MENDQAKYRAEEDYKKKLLGRIEEIEEMENDQTSIKLRRMKKNQAVYRIEENEKNGQAVHHNGSDRGE